jgi:abequosyltransferase
MQDDQPLLTIAIPTYNRSRFLTELLDILKPQMTKAFSIELIISDNASTDDTQVILEEFSKSGLAFRYIRNKSNLGADRNVLQCFEEARGKYVWIFGDDDIILPGALKKIIRLLSQQDYDLIYVRPYEFLNDYKIGRRDDPANHKALVVNDARLFAEMVGVMFTFISGMIVNKQRFDEIPHPSCSKSCGTQLNHLSWIFPILASFRKGLFIFDKLVAGRGGNSGNYNLCEVFGKNLKQLSAELLWQDPRLGFIITNDVLRQWFPNIAIRLRKQQAGNFNQENLDQNLRSVFSSNYRYWFFVLPLIKTPLWFAEIWLFVGRNINRVRSLPLKAYREIYYRNDYLRTTSL